jgi:hypothetical protein
MGISIGNDLPQYQTRLETDTGNKGGGGESLIEMLKLSLMSAHLSET